MSVEHATRKLEAQFGVKEIVVAVSIVVSRKYLYKKHNF